MTLCIKIKILFNDNIIFTFSKKLVKKKKKKKKETIRQKYFDPPFNGILVVQNSCYLHCHKNTGTVGHQPSGELDKGGI